MKKIFLIVLASIMVLGFAASAFAIHAEIPAETQAVVGAGSIQITLGGEIRTRGWYRDNLAKGFALGYADPLVVGVDAPSAAWWDERVRLSLDAKEPASGVEGFVQIESTSDDAGDKYVWGHGQSISQAPGSTNSKPNGSLDLLQAWIQYSGAGLLGFPSGFKIGHMPLKLAYGQFFDNTQYGDDALVLFASPVKGFELAALTFKGEEGAITDNHDDLDAYVGLATYKWNDANLVGINYTYLNSNSVLGENTNLKMQDLGLHADGKIGGFGYRVAGDIQFGSVGEDSIVGKADFQGWAVQAALNYDFNAEAQVPLNVRGSFAYGSGQDDDEDGDIKEFVPFVGNIQNYSFIYEYQASTTAFNPSGLNSATPADGHAAGVANTMYFNLGLDWMATKELTVSADGYLFYATETGAFEQRNKRLGIHSSSVDDNAGWEVDAKIKYAVAKNLTYQIDAGYFKAEDFYEDAYGLDTKGVTAIRHMLTFSF